MTIGRPLFHPLWEFSPNRGLQVPIEVFKSKSHSWTQGQGRFLGVAGDPSVRPSLSLGWPERVGTEERPKGEGVGRRWFVSGRIRPSPRDFSVPWGPGNLSLFPQEDWGRDDQGDESGVGGETC